MRFELTLFVCALLITSCSTTRSISQKKYAQFQYFRKYTLADDSVEFRFKNPLLCPLRINISCEDKNLENKFGVLLLKEKQDTVFKMPTDKSITQIMFYAHFGDINRKVIFNELALPIATSKPQKLIQAYNGSFSHRTDYSIYALDFDLKVNDTVYCADKGFVVGIIKDYNNNGGGSKLRDQANYITVYHPHSGLYTQYGHLVFGGSFVKIGDRVEKGQAIGLSGKTGFTNIEHLHFNTLVPSINGGLVSVPVIFDGNLIGEKLQKGMLVKRK